jgi:hypothetical protein
LRRADSCEKPNFREDYEILGAKGKQKEQKEPVIQM